MEPSADHNSMTACSWAVRLNRIDASIGMLRQLPGVVVLPIESASQNAVWIKGQTLDDRVSRTLRSLPDAERFLVATNNSLTFWGETVPRATLPDGTWLPISEWLTLQMPAAGFSASINRHIALNLVRSDVPVEANLLKVGWSLWRDYAFFAPQIRLNQWAFAVSDNGEALIRGRPVAPLPGIRYVEQAGIAIPAGWRLEPPIAEASLHQAMSLGPGTIAVISEAGVMDVIPDSAFVCATRSAVRLTDNSMAECLGQ